MGFPGGSDSKESVCKAEDSGLIPGSGRSPREGNGYPLHYFLPEEFHGQKSLAGYSPSGGNESDMTEWLTLSLSTILYKINSMDMLYNIGNIVNILQ